MELAAKFKYYYSKLQEGKRVLIELNYKLSDEELIEKNLVPYFDDSEKNKIFYEFFNSYIIVHTPTKVTDDFIYIKSIMLDEIFSTRLSHKSYYNFILSKKQLIK